MAFRLITRLFYSPLLVQLVPTRRCNLRCGYCNEWDSTSPPVPIKTVRAWLDKLHQLGTFAIEFSGGEPLLHPGIVELIAHASRLRFLKRMLITNGFLLTERIIREMNDAGLTDLQVSVDGVKPNRTTIKTLDPLRQKLERLARLARFKVTINAVVGSAPPDELREVVRFAQERSFRITVGLLHDERGAFKLSDVQRDLYRELKRQVNLSWRPGSDNINLMLEGLSAPFKCRAGSRYLYVDEGGKVHYCSQTRDWFSKDLMQYTPEDLKKQFHTAKPCQVDCTIGCVRTTSALDSWRSQGKNQLPR